jgi:hypothetical protein
MDGDSTAPTNSRGPDTASAPAAMNPSQSSEEPKSSPVTSMSGALQPGDLKDGAKDVADGDSMRITSSSSFQLVQVRCAD